MRAFMARRLVRCPVRDARAALGSAAAVLALVALAAAGCGENGASSGPSASAPVGGAASPVVQHWLSDLVAPPGVSFEVVFRRYNPAVDASSYFVWRQGNGRRRWDDVPIKPEGANVGDFSLEIDFSGGRHFGDPSIGCSWSTLRAGPGEALVRCRPSGASTFRYAPVTTALMSYVGETLPDETIAGRSASCYSLESPSALEGEFSRAVVCLDSSQGIPLRLEIESQTEYSYVVEMEAISVSLDEQNLVVPVELQPNPERPEFSWLRQFNGTVPLATLQLPDLSHFQQ